MPYDKLEFMLGSILMFAAGFSVGNVLHVNRTIGPLVVLMTYLVLSLKRYRRRHSA
jgi:hypothetical protein